MGLAGPKKRRKIGHDPNNTAWSRSGSSYGQKILTAQGWNPGSYLGAKDAPQSEFFSQANASHIRVLLKDDNRGLGASSSHGGEENFGLASLQDLYGRLNGKGGAQLEKEERHRADVSRRLYMDRKWGSLEFIRGGFLVGDRIEADIPDHNPNEVLEQEQERDTAKGIHENYEETPKARRKSRKGKKGRSKRSDKETTDAEDQDIEENESHSTAASSDNPQQTLLPKELRRLERKAMRRQHKSKKKLDAECDEASSQMGDLSVPRHVSGQARAAECNIILQKESEGISPDRTQNGSATVNEAFVRSSEPRTSVRNRFIRQKKLSSTDPEALRQILMLKA